MKKETEDQDEETLQLSLYGGADDPDAPGDKMTRAERQADRQRQRRLLKEDWLAPAGSEEEKQLLKRLLKQEGLSEEKRQMVRGRIENPDGYGAWNGLFTDVFKPLVIGPPVYYTAIDRQGRLNDHEWLVAYYTVRGVKQKKIARLTHVSEARIDQLIVELKDKIREDYNYEIETIDQAQIIRWFLGL